MIKTDGGNIPQSKRGEICSSSSRLAVARRHGGESDSSATKSHGRKVKRSSSSRSKYKSDHKYDDPRVSGDSDSAAIAWMMKEMKEALQDSLDENEDLMKDLHKMIATCERLEMERMYTQQQNDYLQQEQLESKSLVDQLQNQVKSLLKRRSSPASETESGLLNKLVQDNRQLLHERSKLTTEINATLRSEMDKKEEHANDLHTWQQERESLQSQLKAREEEIRVLKKLLHREKSAKKEAKRRLKDLLENKHRHSANSAASILSLESVAEEDESLLNEESNPVSSKLKKKQLTLIQNLEESPKDLRHLPLRSRSSNHGQSGGQNASECKEEISQELSSLELRPGSVISALDSVQGSQDASEPHHVNSSSSTHHPVVVRWDQTGKSSSNLTASTAEATILSDELFFKASSVSSKSSSRRVPRLPKLLSSSSASSMSSSRRKDQFPPHIQRMLDSRHMTLDASTNMLAAKPTTLRDELEKTAHGSATERARRKDLHDLLVNYT